MADRTPATRAIVEAFDDRYELCGPFDDNWQELCLAAALRALADHQQAPITMGKPIDHWSPGARIRQEMRNIVAELEGTTRDPLEPNNLSHLSDEEFQALAPQGYHGL